MRSIISCVVAFFVFASISCEKPSFNVFKQEVVFTARYRNVSSNPELSIDGSILPSILKIGATSASIINQRAVCRIDNVVFSDELGVYKVISSKTEELRNGQWEVDSENFLQPESTQSIDLVLVLDVSSSLGNDVQIVKSSAKNFLNGISQSVSNCNIGIVGFSQDITSLQLTENIEEATTFIDNLTGVDATKLYESIDAGLSVLEQSNSVTKALVVFTDGKNNAWSDESLYSEPNYVKSRILSNSEISTYMIGFQGKGGVDSEILNSFVSNFGSSAYANKSSEINGLFDRIQNTVTSIYSFKYDRNSSPVDSWRDLKFTLSIQLQ